MVVQGRYGYRKRIRKNDGSDALVWIFTIIIASIVGLFIGIVKLISNLFKWIVKLYAEKSINKQYQQNIVNNTKNKVISKPKELKKYIDQGPITTYEENTLRVPNKYVETPYDNLFESQIKKRGIAYYEDKKVINYNINGQICSAEIIGTDNYQTSIIFYKNKNIKKANCTCPYFKKDNNYCKHIYALLLEYCYREKIEGYINIETYKEIKNKEPKTNTNYYNRMLDICNSMKEIINNAEDFYNSCEIQDDIDIEDIYNEIIDYKDKINTYGNTKLTDLSEELIESAKDELYELENLYENLSLEYETIIETKEEEERLEQEDMLLAGAAAYQIMNKRKKKKEKEEYELEREELRKTWELMDHEIDEVQKGNYEPWQFEEPGSGEELEEDDYYYDDLD